MNQANQALSTLNAILQSSSAGPQPFPPTSRYYGLPVATRLAADGRILTYLTRRFVPQPDSLAQLTSYRVVQGDRPDSIAARSYNDPEQWWRLADANGVIHPGQLTRSIGTLLRITLPAGFPLAKASR